MSAPSFSSFPPSFASFPDIDPGPSTRPDSRQGKVKEKEQGRKHDRKSRREDDRASDGEQKRKKRKHERHREREGSKGVRHRSRSRSRTRHDQYGGDDDERAKLEEDRRQRLEERPSGKEGLVYFTDRKGDPLNVRYGGLYAGDVPKYRLVDCKWCIVLVSDN